MIKDHHNPNPKFKLLVDDQMILLGDEYYDNVEDRWYTVPSIHVGDLYKGPYGYDHFLIIRRKQNK